MRVRHPLTRINHQHEISLPWIQWMFERRFANWTNSLSIPFHFIAIDFHSCSHIAAQLFSSSASPVSTKKRNAIHILFRLAQIFTFSYKTLGKSVSMCQFSCCCSRLRGNAHLVRLHQNQYFNESDINPKWTDNERAFEQLVKSRQKHFPMLNKRVHPFLCWARAEKTAFPDLCSLSAFRFQNDHKVIFLHCIS